MRPRRIGGPAGGCGPATGPADDARCRSHLGSALPGKRGLSPFAAKPIVGRQHATLGANATILGGVTVEIYGVVGAGAVVTHDVPSYAVMTGVPARVATWLCRCTRHSLNLHPRSKFSARCPACGRNYRLIGTGAEEYSPAEESRRRKAELYRMERRFVESTVPQ